MNNRDNPVRLAKHNGWTQGVDRVWLSPSNHAFSYSDGEDAERWLDHVLSSVDDLSSQSQALQGHIVDWPSEYHLSFERGNLLRALNLGASRHILEVGCGCGSVSRYLGEQGLLVDSIEGSRVRAAFAARRVVDLESVEVSCGNFNELEFAEETYDAIIFVGVLEYAARFSKDPQSEDASDTVNDARSKPELSNADEDADARHRAAIVRMLRKCKHALKPDGVVVVAIENRLGLKYLLGFREDHYGIAYEGLFDYPNDSGIRTFTRSDWREMSAAASLDSDRFLYPYPDYKLPRVVVSHEFLKAHRHAAELVSGLASRDYVAAVPGVAYEDAVRDGLAQLGHLPEVANSFLMVFGRRDAVDRVADTDFVHITGANRRRRFRTLTKKLRGDALVTKEPLWSGDAGPGSVRASAPADVEPVTKQIGSRVGDGFVRQRLVESRYIDGMPLERVWRQQILTQSDEQTFIESIAGYRRFLEREFGDAGARRLCIDAVLSNVIVEQTGSWQLIDLEWETEDEMSLDFVLFRALLYFFVHNSDLFRAVGGRFGASSLSDLIMCLCARSGVDVGADWENWIALEERFQRAICGETNVPDVRAALTQSPTAERFEARVYWSEDGEPTDDRRMRTAYGSQGAGRQKLRFRLPAPLSRVKFLRFDPTEASTYFHLFAMRLFARDRSGVRRELFCLKGGEAIRNAVDMIRIDFASGVERDVYFALDDDPIIHIGLEPWLDDEIVGEIEFEVEMDCPRSADYRVLADRFLGDIDALEARLAASEQDNKTLKDARVELEQLKNSRVWRIAERGRYLFYKRAVGRLPSVQNLLLRMSRLGLRDTLRQTLVNQKGETPVSGDHSTPAVEAEQRHNRYDQWREGRVLTTQMRDDYRKRISQLTKKPLISVVMPVYNVDGVWLERAIDSVRAQLYENWQLIIVDDNSTHAETRKVLDWTSDPKIHVQVLESNRNISGATNEGLRLASGEYIAFLDHDDELSANALAEIVFSINASDPDIIYTDEDFITLEGRHVNPHFKPDFSPDLLLSHNYITHLTVVRKSLLDKVGGLRSEFDGAQDYDLWLRLAEETETIAHIPKVLYHWRMVETSTSLDANAKPQALEASKRALEEALQRRNESASVMHANIPYFFRVKRRIEDRLESRVSIVIPFKDKPELLESSIGRILEVSTFKNFEIVGISNNSERDSTFRLMRELEKRDARVRFIEYNEPFNFSELTNVGVRASDAPYIALVNNDVEVISWDWIECLLEHAARPNIGVVGGKLYYPDNTIQHAGIIVGIGGYAGHPHKHFNSKRSGYFNRASVQQNVSAVTGAFMMFRRDVFDEVGGFDEVDFKVACNDVDFCLRVREREYLNIFTPYAQAYHHESLSRGYEDTDEKRSRFDAEKAKFQARHQQLLSIGDPYYNPNFALDNEHFGIRV